ncbi:hypothetical protein [Pseudonocardia sp. TRM90224]|uniref:hypothetical protein n=1 Tax=Pseudonocardia sp. TRM90224 TaxID=2812678 RepID=UPI001E43E945|nr:hypothetical protein [Pseudonocardia sp. TRM90224]
MAAGAWYGLILYAFTAAMPLVLPLLFVRLLPAVGVAICDALRREPCARNGLGPVVAELRSLHRRAVHRPQLNPGGFYASYDCALLNACRLVGVDTPLAAANAAERPFARLQAEAALEAAGIRLNP